MCRLGRLLTVDASCTPELLAGGGFNESNWLVDAGAWLGFFCSTLQAGPP